MTCEHCEDSGNKITVRTECEDGRCSIVESTCICACHVAIEGAKEYNDI